MSNLINILPNEGIRAKSPTYFDLFNNVVTLRLTACYDTISITPLVDFCSICRILFIYCSCQVYYNIPLVCFLPEIYIIIYVKKEKKEREPKIRKKVPYNKKVKNVL